MISLRVYGSAAPQGSKVRTKWGMREASEKVKPWREAIVGQAIRDGIDNVRLTGPVSVRVTFLFPRTKAHYGVKKGQPYLRDNAPTYKTTAPDLDKLQRSTGDGLVQAGVLADDDSIVRWHAEKRYCNDGESPGAIIVIDTL